MGHHFVSFKVTLNVTRSGAEKTIEAIGSGWFQEKLYQVWAYPERDKGSYFNADDDISFSARFNGVSESIYVPIRAVEAIYARENGQGMMFSDDDYSLSDSETDADDLVEENNSDAKSKKSKSKPNLHIVK